MSLCSIMDAYETVIMTFLGGIPNSICDILDTDVTILAATKTMTWPLPPKVKMSLNMTVLKASLSKCHKIPHISSNNVIIIRLDTKTVPEYMDWLVQKLNVQHFSYWQDNFTTFLYSCLRVIKCSSTPHLFCCLIIFIQNSFE